MPTRHLSLRLDEDAFERLDAESRRTGATRSELAKTLLDEGLRMEAHPGVVFRPGPAGRRAALAGGPDVWEVIRAFRAHAGAAEDAIRAVAADAVIAPQQIHVALRYYAEHQGEIDRWIERVDAEAERAEAAWRRQQLLLRR